MQVDKTQANWESSSIWRHCLLVDVKPVFACTVVFISCQLIKKKTSVRQPLKGNSTDFEFERSGEGGRECQRSDVKFEQQQKSPKKILSEGVKSKLNLKK